MKKLSGFAAVAVLCGSLLGGCGGSSSNFAAAEQAMLNCSQSTMTTLISVFVAFNSVPDVIAGDPALPGYDIQVVQSVDPLDPPNTWDFSVVFDTNANGIKDSAIVGKVTFSADPTDGLDPGDILAITFQLQNTPVLAGAPVENGTVTGSVDVVATLGATPEIATITGTASFADSADAGCTADLVFPVGTPLTLDFSGSTPAQLAANVGLFEIFGLIQSTLETLGYTFNGDVTVTEGSQTVTVVGDIDGVDVDLDFELLPSDEAVNALANCFFFNVEWSFYLAETFDKVRDAVLGGVPPAGIVVTATANPNVFDYSVDLLLFDPANFTGGTITGQATLAFPVVTGLAGITPAEVAFTWTVNNATFDSGDVTSGQNTTGRPLRLRLDGAGTVTAFSGAGTITTVMQPQLVGAVPTITCTTTLDIPETDPIAADESDGLLFVTVTIGDDVLTGVLDFEASAATLTINGIPFPFFGF
ncbi:MAG TPA: hypothetical protein VFY93_12620 [Planctomycetota bacterium]|nr:hypothetical protein [Planctomycetota bacterium]